MCVWWWCVCWCWCWCWCVTLISTSTLSTPLLSPCVRSKRLPVCTGTTQVLPLEGVVPVHTEREERREKMKYLERMKRDRDETRWKKRWFCRKMFVNTQIQVNQPCFEIKSLSGELFLFFLRTFRILPFFSIIYMIRIRFFGLRESFQQKFRAAQYHSGRGSLMTVLSRETGASGKFYAMFSCHDVFQICRPSKCWEITPWWKQRSSA